MMISVAIKSPAKSPNCCDDIYEPITHGVAESTPAIMIIDIPLLIPYSVITSPSHIRKIVPAVAINMAIRTTPVSVISTIVPPAKELSRTIIP